MSSEGSDASEEYSLPFFADPDSRVGSALWRVSRWRYAGAAPIVVGGAIFAVGELTEGPILEPIGPAVVVGAILAFFTSIVIYANASRVRCEPCGFPVESSQNYCEVCGSEVSGE